MAAFIFIDVEHLNRFCKALNYWFVLFQLGKCFKMLCCKASTWLFKRRVKVAL